MEKLNNLLEGIASPLKAYANCLLRIGLGLSFFFMATEKYQSMKDLLGGWLQKGSLQPVWSLL